MLPPGAGYASRTTGDLRRLRALTGTPSSWEVGGGEQHRSPGTEPLLSWRTQALDVYNLHCHLLIESVEQLGGGAERAGSWEGGCTFHAIARFDCPG